MLNPKHSTVPATKKKINSIPAETRTYGNNFEAELLDSKAGKYSKVTGNLEELLD